MKKFAFILILWIFSYSTQATNGYWSHGYGPKSKSIAGACVAMAFGAMCTASNPGSLAVVGNRLEVGAALFLPTRGFTANDNASPLKPPAGYPFIPPGEYQSKNDFFLIPHFAFNYMIDTKSSIGVTIGGNGGMNTEYSQPVFQNFGNPNNPSTIATTPTSIDLTQLFIGIPYSYRLTPKHSIGIAPILSIQRFKAEGLQPFTAFSLYPEQVTNNGYDMAYGAGIRLGWLWQVNDRLNLGFSYQSRIWGTPFDKYKGLFAEEGDFDIPPNYDIGFAYKLLPQLTFAFNYQRIEFKEINALGNRSNQVFIPGKIELGTDSGIGFGWDDIDVYKLGLEWKYNLDWTLRAGFSYASDTFSHEQSLFNILAPGVVKRHYTIGFGRKVSSNSEVNLAILYAPNEKIHGNNPNTGPQTGFLEMDQWEIEVGWGMRF